MTPEEINDLARRIVTGEVYLPPHAEAIECSFGAFLLLLNLPKRYASKVGLVYEDMAKATPRALNGYPMFFSCRFCHREDSDAVISAVVAKQEAIA